MATREITCHIVVCAVCGQPLQHGRDEAPYTPHFRTERVAVASATENEWTDLGNGRLACPASDPAHDDARDAIALSA